MKEIKLTKEEIIKAEVLSTSRQLFKRFGYQKTTMEDIARGIGRGKSTLYYYYKSKEEIFEAIVERELKDLLSIIGKKVDKASTAEEKLKVYAVTAYEVIKEKAVLNDVIFNEMIKTGGVSIAQPSMVEHLSKVNEQWFLIMRNILIFGINNKEFSLSLDEVERSSHAIFTSLVSTALMLSRFGHDEDLEMPVSGVLASVVNIFVNGLK
jgi:AcrR family transcriptional regulator